MESRPKSHLPMRADPGPQKAAKEVAPLLPPQWTNTIYHNGDQYGALQGLLSLLHVGCWIWKTNQFEGGVGYVGTHAHGESREW